MKEIVRKFKPGDTVELAEPYDHLNLAAGERAVVVRGNDEDGTMALVLVQWESRKVPPEKNPSDVYAHRFKLSGCLSDKQIAEYADYYEAITGDA